MLHVIPRTTMTPTSRTVKFEGEPYGAPVSFFLVDNEPGQGPDLHTHPYSEVFTVVSGRALLTAGDEQLEVGREQIAVVGPETPHGFKNLGPDRLEIVCIHTNATMIQTWLEQNT
jgi:mannose-6-phosphate isomerase-like protein (cupin superfamily)